MPHPLQDPDLNFSARNLPHWTYKDSIYFVTWKLYRSQAILTTPERLLIAQVLHHFDGQKYLLFCYVVMDNHVHALVKPSMDFSLSQVMHSWKSYSAMQLQREFKRRNRIWQNETYDRIVRNEKEFFRIAKYILKNPVTKWGLENYPFAWFRTAD